MPYQISWEQHGVYVQYHGTCTEIDVEEIRNILSHDPRLATITYILNDYFACDGFALSPAFIKELAKRTYHPVLASRILKIAFVTSIPEIIAVASEYLQRSLSQHEYRVFQDLTQACDWCRQ